MSDSGLLRLIGRSVFLVMALASTNGANAREVSLAGSHAINVDADSTTFAAPDFDDRNWPKIEVPSSLRDAGFDARIDVFWYRIKFDLPADWSSNAPAIRLGIVDRADETFLNGKRIGGTGKVGPRESDWHVYPPILPRLYPFDQDILVKGGENVLAIRVGREPYIDDGGIIVGPVALVEMSDALPDYLLLRQRFLSINYLLLGIETIIMLSVLAALYLRPRYRSIWLFLVLYTPYFINALERRDLFHLLGLDHPALQHAANIIGALSFVGLISFAAHIFGHAVGKMGRAVQVASVVTLISLPFTGVPVLDWWVMESALVWHALLLLGLLLLVFWAVRAVVERKAHSWPLSFGLLVLAATMYGDVVFSANTVEAVFGFRLAELGVLTLFLSVGFIAAHNVLMTDQALIRANTDVLKAHEQERERLARDIHDGVGQWLTTIKLRLELLGSDTETDPIQKDVKDLVEDVDHAIEDTRRVAQDLSPVFLDEQGLTAAMRNLAMRATQNSNLKLDLDLQSSIGLPAAKRDHVYRVFQEALNNAISHSRAQKITIGLTGTRGVVILTVSDDGNGISRNGNQPGSEFQDRGLGLKTMNDRARLLDGKLDVTSKAGVGTTILLRFPL